MLTVSGRLGELRAHYASALVAIANEIGSADRTVEGAVALSRVRVCLAGGRVYPPLPAGVDDGAVKARIAEFVVALKTVLRSFRPMDEGEENQVVVADLEQELGGLLA